MLKINLDYFKDKEKVSEIFDSYQERVTELNQSLVDRKCEGAEMLAWMDFPFNYDKDEIQRIASIGKIWYKNKNIKNVIVIGIGGSYIGIKACIDMCLPFFNREKRIIYVATLSPTYLSSLISKLEKEDFYLVIISKSGKTLEPSIGFKLLYELLCKKHGSELAKDRIIAVTDEKDGILRSIVNKYNLTSFIIPSNIGGRFSAITPVGLVPMAIMGLDIFKVLEGCQMALKDMNDENIINNEAYQYAVLRNHMYAKEKTAFEVFITYEPNLFFISEHWKQLFAESEGKDGKGLYTTNCLFTTDLHSVGQYLQEGKKQFFETQLILKEPLLDTKISNFLAKDDGLNYIENKSLDEINKVAAISTMEAHFIEGNIDIIQLELDKANEQNFGYLFLWLSKSLAMSALLLNVNPFNQPGVEAYKNRMFAKLKKDSNS